MHRSGTSALSRAMNICGWRLASRIMPPSPGNPAGYWEPIEIVRFNDRLLKAIGHHWADPAPLPEGWFERPAIAAMRAEAADILQADFAGLDAILLKDPRFSRLLPFWEQVFADLGTPPPACLLMLRSPVEVAQSLAARERMELRHGLLLWLAYMLEAELLSRGSPRAIVDYDALLSDWRASLTPALDVVWPAAIEDMESGAADLQKFLDPGHRHFAAEAEELSAAGDAAPLIERAVEWFGSARRDEKAVDEIREDWRQFWRRSDIETDRRAMMEALPSRHFETATGLLQAGAPDKALASIDRAVAAVPDAPHYRARRAEILAALGRTEEAIAGFEKAIEIGGMNSNQLRNLCEQYIAAGRGGDAIATARKAVRRDEIGLDRQVPWVISQLAARLEAEGRLDEACEMYAIAIEGDPHRHTFHEGHSKVLRAAGRTEEAIAAIRKAIEAGPDIPRYKRQLERLLAADGGEAGL